VQNGWSLGAIEQNSDAGRARTFGDNDAKLASKVRTPNSSELVDPETCPDCKPVCFQIHGSAQRKREQIDPHNSE
jgi:hypothetical protein